MASRIRVVGGDYTFYAPKSQIFLNDLKEETKMPFEVR